MKMIIPILFSLILAGCAHEIVRVWAPKDDGSVAIADQVAATFVQANNVYSDWAGRGDPAAWRQFEPIFAQLLEPKLLVKFRDYMELTPSSVPQDDQWWFQRGVLYLDGNAPWRCIARRVSVNDGVVMYRVDQSIHTSKGSFGTNEPIYFSVSMDRTGARVNEIYFTFDPAQKGKSQKAVPIQKFFEYASRLSN